jgi:hypothetical protein
MYVRGWYNHIQYQDTDARLIGHRQCFTTNWTVRSPCPSLLQVHVEGAQSAALAFVFGARATAVGAVQLVVGPGAGASHCFSRALCACVLEKLRVGRGTCLLAHRQPCTACIGFQLPKANAVLAKEKRSYRPAERVKKSNFEKSVNFFLRENSTLLIVINHYIMSAGYNPEQNF